MHELVEMEVRELLSEYDYDGDNIPIIRGSALAMIDGTDKKLGEEAIDKLIEAMDASLEPSERDVDKPFLLSVEGSFNIAGRGTVATGTVEQGKVKLGDDVQLIGVHRRGVPTTVVGLEAFKKSLDHAEAGDNVGALLRGL